MREFVRNYLKNREEFYSILLPRVPHEHLRTLLTEAVAPVRAAADFLAGLDAVDFPDLTPFLSALGFQDLIKKPTFGGTWGRTVISIEEALSRSETVEETGVVLFQALAVDIPAFVAEAERRRTALAAVLRLNDDLRYHRIAV